MLPCLNLWQRDGTFGQLYPITGIAGVQGGAQIVDDAGHEHILGLARGPSFVSSGQGQVVLPLYVAGDVPGRHSHVAGFRDGVLFEQISGRNLPTGSAR